MSDLPAPIDVNPVFHYLGAMKNVTVTLSEDSCAAGAVPMH